MGQAAKEAGVSKATIHRAIKSGKLSASRLDDGSYEIDPAELFRVYRPAKRIETVSVRQIEPPADTAENRLRETEIHLLRERIDELVKQRDAWQQQAERLALTGPPHRPPGDGGWFGLFRKRS